MEDRKEEGTNLEKEIFETLSQINFEETDRSKVKVVNRKDKFGNYIEQALEYVSWATAWDVLLEHFPNSSHRDIEFDDNGFEVIPGTMIKMTGTLPDGTTYETERLLRGHPFRKNANGYEVETEVTVNGISKRCRLPIMDNNGSAATIIDPNKINKSLKRCFVKNLAEFGLGLYIYAGEFFADEEESEKKDGESLKASVSNTGRKLKTKNTAKPKKSEKEEDNPETDPMKRTIKTPYNGASKGVGQPMSVLITEAKSVDSSMKLLDWYEKNGKNGDAELAMTLKAMLKAGKISFPKELVA